MHRRILRAIGALLPLLLLAAGLLQPETAAAQSRRGRLLVINSFNMVSPWSQSVLSEITTNGARTDAYVTKMANMNSTVINDSASYREAVNKIFAENTTPPDYVVLLGDMSFTLMDDIRREWGNLPMTLFGTSDRLYPVNYYYSGPTSVEAKGTPLSEIQDTVNFTYVEIPMSYRETVDLMHDMNPTMDRIIFASDELWFNRTLSLNIREYVRQKYPEIRFSWVTPEQGQNQVLAECLLDDDPRMCILFSSWIYSRDPQTDTSELQLGAYRMLRQAVRPVYALRRAYLFEGALGGFFSDQDKEYGALTNAIMAMTEGRDMRHMPFFYPAFPADYHYVVNEEQLLARGYSRSSCPKGTIFINQSGHTEETSIGLLDFLSVVGVLTLVIGVGSWFLVKRRSELISLKRHYYGLLNDIPASYALLSTDPDGMVTGVIDSNQSFNDGGGIKALLDLPMCRHTVQRAITSGKPEEITIHSPENDTYTVIYFVPRKNNRMAVFSADTSEVRRELKRSRESEEHLATALDVAGVIGWHWDIRHGHIDLSGKSVIAPTNTDFHHGLTADEFFKRVDPEDVARIHLAYNELINRQSRTINERFRWLSVGSDGTSNSDWVEVHATVDTTDPMGKPLSITGSFMRVPGPKPENISEIVTIAERSHSGQQSLLIAISGSSSRLLLDTLLKPTYKITYVDSARDVADAIANRHFDGVIIDITTIPRDAFIAARDLHTRRPGMTIVAITPYAWSADRTVLIDTGFTAVVSKPVTGAKLAEALK